MASEAFSIGIRGCISNGSASLIISNSVSSGFSELRPSKLYYVLSGSDVLSIENGRLFFEDSSKYQIKPLLPTLF